MDDLFDTVLYRQRDQEPCGHRHLSPNHPCACGWVTEPGPNGPVPGSAAGHEDLPLCKDCLWYLGRLAHA